MSITRLKKIPYSKNLNLREIADELSLCWLYCGADSWKAKNDINDRSVLLPPNENPADYDWSFMRNQFVIANVIGFTSLDYRERIAMYVCRAGAKQVDFFLPYAEEEFLTHDMIIFTSGRPHERYCY